MRLEKKHQEELAKRKGMATKTIIQGIGLIISFAIAYFVTTYLFNQEILTYPMLYNALSIPRSVPEWAILGGLMVIIVFVMQFAMFVGFFLVNPEGRRRLGDPSLHSRNVDPYDQHFH